MSTKRKALTIEEAEAAARKAEAQAAELRAAVRAQQEAAAEARKAKEAADRQAIEALARKRLGIEPDGKLWGRRWDTKVRAAQAAAWETFVQAIQDGACPTRAWLDYHRALSAAWGEYVAEIYAIRRGIQARWDDAKAKTSEWNPRLHTVPYKVDDEHKDDSVYRRTLAAIAQEVNEYMGREVRAETSRVPILADDLVVETPLTTHLTYLDERPYSEAIDAATSEIREKITKAANAAAREELRAAATSATTK